MGFLGVTLNLYSNTLFIYSGILLSKFPTNWKIFRQNNKACESDGNNAFDTVKVYVKDLFLFVWFGLVCLGDSSVKWLENKYGNIFTPHLLIKDHYYRKLRGFK